MRKIILLLFIALVVANITNSLSAQPSKSIFTLDEAITSALRHNFDIKISNAQISSSSAGLTSAFGEYLPTMGVNMGYSRQLNPDGVRTANVGGLIIEIPGTNPNSYSMNASASVTIFDGFSREANYKRASRTYDATVLSKDFTIENVKIVVYRQFINILSNAQIVRVRSENLNSGRKELERIQAQYEAGMVPLSTVYAQEAELGIREMDLLSAENALNISKSQLLAFMGLQPDMNVEFVDRDIPTQISDEEILNFRREIGSLNAAIAYALENRLDYKSSKYQIDASQSSVSIARSGNLPRLSASLGWSWNHFELDRFEDGRSFFGLNFNIPVFENFNTYNQVQNAKLSLEQRRVENQRLEQNIRTAIQTCFWNLETAEKQIEISQRGLRSARLNFESTQERFNVGAANITELIQANSQYITSQINQINAIYGYLTSKNELLFEIGKLN